MVRPILRFSADRSTRKSIPLGRFLTAAHPLVVAEEEIRREGVNTQLHWQLSRDIDGRYHLWLSHRVRVGHGEGSSGLVFDVARNVS